MESLHYDSIIAISAFWVAFVIGFIIVIYRIRRRKCHNVIQPTASPQPEQRRIIHIYYIENVDSNHNTTLSNPDGFLNHALRRIDDQPPSYNDVTQEPEAGSPTTFSSEPQSDGSESGVNSSTSSSGNRVNSSSMTHQSDAVVLVEETKIS